MSGAFLALWNGINQPGAREEYEAWHAIEHVPERVALPGFLWGRRYLGGVDGLGYFTLYGLQGLDALQTPQYADVIAHPTPWSARMRPRLSAFVRRPCVQLAGAGASTAAHLVTVRAVTTDLPAWQRAAAAAVLQAEDSARLVRATAGAVPPSLALAYPVGGERIAEAVAGQTTVVLLAEHCTPEGARSGAQWLCDQLAPWTVADALPGTIIEPFALQSQVARAELPLAAAGRLPARAGPMARYFQP